jgi:chromosome partitioning protein
MLTISVSNIKGGSGKTTIATNVAAWCAARGLRTALGDLDPQHGALGWLARRPADRPKIAGYDLDAGEDVAPKKLDVLVVDGVAAMRRKDSRDLVRDCDCLLIPVLPSILDEDGTRRYLDQIDDLKPVRKGKRRIGFVANRVRLRSHASTRLNAFLAAHDFPTVASLRETGLYTDAALRGLGIGEMTGRRAEPYQAEWVPLLDFLLAG